MPILSQTADLALTAAVRIGPREMKIRWNGENRFEVWLPTTQRFDPPDGWGDTVSEALEDAARKVRL